MSAEVFMGLVAVIAIYVLSSPFFKKKNGRVEDEQDKFDDRKEQAFLQLSELEYDYQMEKINEQDYLEMKNKLTLEAAKYVSHSKDDITEIEKMVDNEIRLALEKGCVK
ncbi:hypothetical protein [Bacillus fonticola]|uniref:hypothetical protein n=1 Tax=Bacillus fonticola TaxID=2728853 RepID=UPI00147466D7|nr:hypothetical protein [Bacillus fonticola]